MWLLYTEVVDIDGSLSLQRSRTRPPQWRMPCWMFIQRYCKKIWIGCVCILKWHSELCICFIPILAESRTERNYGRIRLQIVLQCDWANRQEKERNYRPARRIRRSICRTTQCQQRTIKERFLSRRKVERWRSEAIQKFQILSFLCHTVQVVNGSPKSTGIGFDERCPQWSDWKYNSRYPMLIRQYWWILTETLHWTEPNVCSTADGSLHWCFQNKVIRK